MSAAAFMGMPEASVDHDDRLPFRKNEIGFSGQLFWIEAITEAGGKKQFSYQNLRPGVG